MSKESIDGVVRILVRCDGHHDICRSAERSGPMDLVMGAWVDWIGEGSDMSGQQRYDK